MTDHNSMPDEQRWHVSSADLERYVGGTATPSLAASVEPHLGGCERCQAGVATMTRATAQLGDDRLTNLFAEVIDTIDRPVRSPVERVLCRFGLADHVARLLVATPAMQSSWMFAVAATLGFTVLATRSGGLDFGVFLVGAPLVPLVAVAAAFAMPKDATAELSVTAPVRMAWLLMLRSVSVLVTTLLLCGVAAVWLPGHGWENVAWVLPALALASAAAALSTWMQPLTAAGLLAAVWVGGLAATSDPFMRRFQTIDSSSLVQNSVVFAPSGQLVAVCITFLSVLVFAFRRETFDFGRSAT